MSDTPNTPITDDTPPPDGFTFVRSGWVGARLHLAPVDQTTDTTLCGRQIVDTTPTSGRLCPECEHRAETATPVPLVDMADAIIAAAGQPAIDTPDADDVYQALLAAVELAELWMIDGGGGTLRDRLRLHGLLSTLNWNNGRLTEIGRTVEASLAADLPDEPIDVDGTLWSRQSEYRRRGFDADELRRAVTRWATRERVDTETGEVIEPSLSAIMDDVWSLASPATGRTKKFREAGINLGEFSEGERVDRVKPFDPLSVPPSE